MSSLLNVPARYAQRTPRHLTQSSKVPRIPRAPYSHRQPIPVHRVLPAPPSNPASRSRRIHRPAPVPAHAQLVPRHTSHTFRAAHPETPAHSPRCACAACVGTATNSRDVTVSEVRRCVVRRRDCSVQVLPCRSVRSRRCCVGAASFSRFQSPALWRQTLSVVRFESHRTERVAGVVLELMLHRVESRGEAPSRVGRESRNGDL
ncbi:hypothetical protein C8R43DRAFT_522927 [Mycena crocata]|nr:hypothetical protein C8R43DRAFT_522927 [Mycena crocata]